MVDDISDDRLLEYRILFDNFDLSKNGTIPSKSLETILQQLGQSPNKKEINDLIAKYDEGNLGYLSFNSFLRIIVSYFKEKPLEEELKISFDNYKDSQSDYISLSKIKHTLLNSGYDVNEDEINQMLKECDSEEKGALDREEFIKLIMKDITPYVEVQKNPKKSISQLSSK